MPRITPAGYGQYLIGSSYENMCHIPAGQRWEKCDEEEREAYENDLQKKFRKGVEYLWENAGEMGSIGLRMGQKFATDSEVPVKETRVMGFHHNRLNMEEWSSRHPTHLAIFNGSMNIARDLAIDRSFMTWQEVAIPKGARHFLNI